MKQHLPTHKGICEEAYRKMAKTTKVTVQGVEYTLQSVSPTWYADINDKYGILGSRQRNTSGYWDALIKNVVAAPAEVSGKGIRHFDETDDIAAMLGLVREIETFLTE